MSVAIYVARAVHRVAGEGLGCCAGEGGGGSLGEAAGLSVSGQQPDGSSTLLGPGGCDEEIAVSISREIAGTCNGESAAVSAAAGPAVQQRDGAGERPVGDPGRSRRAASADQDVRVAVAVDVSSTSHRAPGACGTGEGGDRRERAGRLRAGEQVGDPELVGADEDLVPPVAVDVTHASNAPASL